MALIDKTYHNLLDKILQEGYTYEDPNRKGVNRIEIPSYTFRHEFKDGFPAITTKKLHYKNVATELIWFLRGDTNIKYLVDNGCNIWNKDAYNYYVKEITRRSNINPLPIEEYIRQIKDSGKMVHYGFECGDLGRVYGHYWRNYDGFDQIQDIIDKMINTPMSSEIIVTARNPNDKDNQALPCCHYGFQIVMKPLEYDYMQMSEECELHFYREYDKYSDGDSTYEDYWNQGWYRYAHKTYPQYGFELHWDQRSVDSFLGLPYNIASYATLALILEKITGYKALGIQGDLKKVHLYDNSLDAVKEQLSRDVDKYSNCQLKGADLTELMDEFDDKEFDLNYFVNELSPDLFELQNYESYPAINVEMLERDE